MKRILILVGILACAFAIVFGVQAKQTPLVVAWADEKPKVVAPEKPAAAGRRDLSIRQRRALGLTVPNIIAAAKELKASGDIDATTSSSEKAALIASKLAEKNPQAYSGVDIEAILAFIEALMQIIDTILELLT